MSLNLAKILNLRKVGVGLINQIIKNIFRRKHEKRK